MSSTIDWSKAPEWAGAVVRSRGGHLFYVAKFGVDGERQRLDNQRDTGIATFPAGHRWTLVETRPIRTPEQIAAEARKSAIKEMQTACNGLGAGAAIILYDAGYRKVEQS